MTYKILVTGGLGFIGSHLVDKLIEKGNEVTVLDNLEMQVHNGKMPNHINQNANYIIGDVRDKKILRKAINDKDIIFHNAAAVGVGQSMYQIQKYVDVNTFATSKLLEILVNEEHDVKKLITASSMSIYGEGAYKCENCGTTTFPSQRRSEQIANKEWELKCPNCKNNLKPIPTPEKKPLDPTSTYAITKRDQEELSLAIGKTYGIPTVPLRYFNVYGPRQSLSNPYTGVLAIFSSMIKNRKPPLIFEDGHQSRDFINVKDIIQANLLAMKKSNANYKTLNVGTGKRTTIKEIAEKLIENFGYNLTPEIVNKYRKGDIRHCYADISKISNLGFKPSTDLDTEIDELKKWGTQVQSKDKVKEATSELNDKNLIM